MIAYLSSAMKCQKNEKMIKSVCKAIAHKVEEGQEYQNNGQD